MFNTQRYAAALLSDPAFVAEARELYGAMLRVEVWHALAELVRAELQRLPEDTDIPDINAIVDAVMPLVMAGLRAQTD